jgi:hypothetical protein
MIKSDAITTVEKNEYSNDQLAITDKQFDSASFVQREPLTVGQRYLLVPQYNNAVKFKINGTEVYGKRAWLLPLVSDTELGTQARTIGFSSMRATGYKHVTDLKSDSGAPTITAKKGADGKWSLSERSGVRAITNTAFITGAVDGQGRKRYAISRPVIITPKAEGMVYVSQFENGDLKTKAGKLDLALNKSFMFYDVEDCNNEALVQEAINALKNAPAAISDNFYARD